MTDKLAEELLKAAKTLHDFTPMEIQALLRRAAFRLQGKLVKAGDLTLISEVADLADEFAKANEMSRDEAVNAIILDWGIEAGLIEIDDLDEEDE
ncbi:hypothetical protein [Nitratireductor sp. GZWM139]|uniref:hypothetical protein n=1 Tax=Nitratireductor sp. GZWM139 TaxID=2950541 RepID=UPI0024BEA96A|nr:hypothetical protein [Nitratireductor sp. GZWM139]MDJ1465689.1 hypothetical protein [Nitratireductor sp. GZWM139]